ncbi:MAG TPA: hypothetical protein VHV75_00105 [Solirubrobacteraceae bacterium]|jgi:hypothetical protein|nr:hypothetical protein [Solirubrobacteraceae bacterium]
MHKSLVKSSRRAAGVLLAVALMSSIAATGAAAHNRHARTSATPIAGSGGARFWIAFDPGGREIGPVQFLSKQVQILNTTSAPNAFTIFYKPQQGAAIVFCKGTLGSAELLVCGAQSSQHLQLGYFEVVAARPVLMGGRSEVPTIGYQQEPNGTFGAETAKGTIQNIPFNWQQGCAPFSGSGCPTTAVAIQPSKKPTAKKN